DEVGSVSDAGAEAARDADADAARHVDAPPDAPPLCAQPPPGVACGADGSCAPSDGCCLEAGACGALVDCFQTHASCDGPEDCEGGACCASAASSFGYTVCSTSCGTIICHSACDCTDAEPACCPYPEAPRFGRCKPSCP